MGESIISERLRRLRKEAEKDLSFFKQHAPALARPAGHEKREASYSPVDIDVEEEVRDDFGNASVEVRRITAMADTNSAPFENIVFRGWIKAKAEPSSVAEARVEAAMRLRSLTEGAAVKGLKAQSYEGGGGTRGPPAPVGDQAIDCMKILGDIRAIVPAADMEAVDQVVLRDVWIWEGKRGAGVRKEVDRVLRGLDYVAMSLGLVTAEEVVRRWPT